MTAERIIMALVIVGIAYGCIIVLYPFSSAILWAAIFTFSSWPIYVHFRNQIGRIIAAIVMLILSIIIVVLPLVIIATDRSSANTLSSLLSVMSLKMHLPPLPEWLVQIPVIGHQIDGLWTKWAHDLSSITDLLKPYVGYMTRMALDLMVHLASGVVQLLLALFIAFFFWINGDTLAGHVKSLVNRVAGSYADRLLEVTGGTIRGTMYGIIGTAIIQGILTGIGFAVVGLPGSVVYGTLTAFLAVLPVGAPLVWIAGSIWLIITHNLGSAIFLFAYGVIIVSGIDHFVRPMFVSRGAQLPYLLTLVGIFGGIFAFGGLGIFLGPALLGVGYTLVVEFVHDSSQKPSQKH